MDKNKSEKLKEVLNKTLNTTDIEKKLHKERDILVQKREEDEKNKAQIKKENEIKEQNIDSKNKDKEELVPKKKIKDEKKDTGLNILIFLVSILAIILLVIAIYLFTKEPTTPVEIENTEKTIIQENLKIEKESFKKLYNSSKKETLKCYKFDNGKTSPNKECKEKVISFIEKNKNALRFEIIPVVGEDDNLIFKKIESSIKHLDKNLQLKVQEYMNRGLSRERVLETSWIFKDKLGEDVILTPTNYYVKSKKNNKGVIIKAYH